MEIPQLQSATCQDFESQLMRSVEHFERASASRSDILKSPSVVEFRARSSELKLSEGANRKFMDLMDKEKPGEAIYFDVENSLQKKMNDQVFQDKGIVDAINNNFLTKMRHEIEKDPILKSRVSAEYKDYKGLRLRFISENPAEKNLLEKRLQAAYSKANSDFAAEVKKTELVKLFATRVDEAQDPSLWFLAGTGDDALFANMSARYARQKRQIGSGGFVRFQDEAQAIAKDMKDIESIRSKLSSNSKLLEMGAMTKTLNGEILLSKESIGILRKSRPFDFKNDEEYFLSIEKKFEKLLGKKPTRNELELMSEYFNKVDALSPPLFQRERVIIDLANAKHGMVSVDFTGVGVDNAYEQMRGLAMANYRQKDALELTSNAFSQMDARVQTVTDEMNASKRFFSEKVKEIRPKDSSPLFSGDDGMFMPGSKDFNLDEKKLLVQKLATHADPSKFRLTFVRSVDDKGVALLPKERSEFVVRAEKLEKEIRDDIISHSALSVAESKKIIIAIDYAPKVKGGDFQLIVSPAQSPEVLQLIHGSFIKRIDQKNGERAVGIIAH